MDPGQAAWLDAGGACPGVGIKSRGGCRSDHRATARAPGSLPVEGSVGQRGMSPSPLSYSWWTEAARPRAPRQVCRARAAESALNAGQVQGHVGSMPGVGVHTGQQLGAVGSASNARRSEARMAALRRDRDTKRLLARSTAWTSRQSLSSRRSPAPAGEGRMEAAERLALTMLCSEIPDLRLECAQQSEWHQHRLMQIEDTARARQPIFALLSQLVGVGDVGGLRTLSSALPGGSTGRAHEEAFGCPDGACNRVAVSLPAGPVPRCEVTGMHMRPTAQ